MFKMSKGHLPLDPAHPDTHAGYADDVTVTSATQAMAVHNQCLLEERFPGEYESFAGAPWAVLHLVRGEVVAADPGAARHATADGYVFTHATTGYVIGIVCFHSDVNATGVAYLGG